MEVLTLTVACREDPPADDMFAHFRCREPVPA